MIGTQRLGRCLNAGRCGLAGQRGPIPVADDAPFTCPECKSELIPFEGRTKKTEPGEKLRGVLKMLLRPALLLVLLIIIGIRYDLFGLELGRPPAISVESSMTLVTAPSSVRTGASSVT